MLWERLLETPPQQVGAVEAIEHLIAQAAPAEFAPGEGSDYSNTGFLLLQLAIEHVTGNSLGEEFQTRIFDPLGMEGSSFPGFGRPDGIISSYATVGDQLVDVTHLPIDDAGDGGIVSTTADMTKFMQALVLDRILIPESQIDGLGQFFDAAGFSEGEFAGHSGNTVGTTSVSLVHMPSGTVISLALTHASEGQNLSALFDVIMTNIMTHGAWADFESSEGQLDFALSAAELGVSEGIGEDGIAQIQLDMQGVSLVLDDALADLDPGRLTFADDSILFIADDANTEFSVEQHAATAVRADNQLIGQDGDDALTGGHGNDRLSGLRGDDWLGGGGGNDHIKGNSGADVIRGNDGNDILHAGSGNDNVKGGGGDDFVRGGRGADRLTGGGGADDLQGHRGDDTIFGNSGADDIKGGGGDDVITGGLGDDTMKGNGGSDIFQFRANDGSDTIKGFQQGQDLIKIIAGANGFDDLNISQDGLNVLVKFSNVDIAITNALTDQFDENDFIF